MISKDDVIAMLDWPNVQEFFRKNGPATITFEIKKTRSTTNLRWSTTQINIPHEQTKKSKNKKSNR